MIVATGDMHGEYGRLLEIDRYFSNYNDQSKYLIVAGDFGYLFKNDFSENKLLDDIEARDYTIIVVPGNHENYDAFMKYDIVDFFGAKAYKIRNNIFYICRGEIFELNEKSFLCIGGGYSIDRYMRRRGVSFWDEEMPTDEEYKYIAENIARYRKNDKKKIDYIITHTAPLSGLLYLGKDHGQQEYPLNNFLEYVREELAEEYEHWFYGHLHIDKEIKNLKQTAIWFDMIKL